MDQTEAELLCSDDDITIGEIGPGDGNGNVNGTIDNNVNNDISNTINDNEEHDMSSVKTEIKLELAALDLNNDQLNTQSAPGDNTPLDQLVQQNSIPVANADGNDDGLAAAERMDLDDPEVFGPFTEFQLAPNIQNNVDQMFYDSFKDQISLLDTAIGLVPYTFELIKYSEIFSALDVFQTLIRRYFTTETS